MASIGNQITSTPYVNDVFSGTGSQTAFTLTYAPATTAAIAVHVAGVYQAPSAYTLSGTTLTFNSAPALGSSNIQVLHLSIGFVAQVPSDGSVTTAKIADGAITADKIADGTIIAADIAANTVTPAKLAYNAAGTILTTDGATVLWRAQSALAIANTQITGVITSTQLANTAVTTGTYGGASNVSVITVDQQGRVTSASNVSISIPSGSYVTNTNNSILTNNTSITSNSTVGAGTGGLSVGPITISANMSVTIANNARWIVL
jgi:hypothetical protein